MVCTEWDMEARAQGRGDEHRSDAARSGFAAGRGGGGGGDMDVRGMPKRPREDGGRGGGGRGAGERVQHATDDRAVDRFIKRQRTRGR